MKISQAKDCLPPQHQISKQKALIVTANGNNENEILLKLRKKVPQFGIMKTMKLNTVKSSFNGNYSESNQIDDNLNSSFDYLNKYHCMINGKPAITLVIPKSGINYLPAILRDIKIDQSSFDYKKVMNKCPKNVETQIFVINPWLNFKMITPQFEHMYGGKTEGGYHVYLTCGTVEFRYKYHYHGPVWGKKTFFGHDFKMYYVNHSKNSKHIFQDFTEEWMLQMQSNLLMLK